MNAQGCSLQALDSAASAIPDAAPSPVTASRCPWQPHLLSRSASGKRAGGGSAPHFFE